MGLGLSPSGPAEGIEFPVFFPVSEEFAAEKGLQWTASTASWLEFLAVADLDGPPSSQLTARSQELNDSDSSGGSVKRLLGQSIQDKFSIEKLCGCSSVISG
jgi:hypothetical protein